MKTLIDYWRHFRTVRNAKCIFIYLYESDKEIPDDLMQELVSIMKKEVDYDNQGILEHEKRAIKIFDSVENRKSGTTKSQVFDELATEFDSSEEVIKRQYYNLLRRKRK